MKKIILGLALTLSFASYSQKDELKTLNKISNKSNVSEKDYKSYQEALTSLKDLAQTDSDKNEYSFYQNYSPIVYINSLGENINSTTLLDVFKDESYLSFLKLANEPTNSKSVQISQGVKTLLPIIKEYAYKFNSESNFENASTFFYNLYKLDNNDGQSLENASILAIQAEKFIIAEKYYKELYESNYTGAGTFYYATNKESNTEERFSSSQERDILVKAGSHDKPRNVNILSKKEEYIKAVAMLAALNKNYSEAKSAYTEAKKFNIKDVSFLLDEANLYYQIKEYSTYEKLLNDILLIEPNNSNVITSLGYAALIPEEKIVEEINASTAPSQREKYDLLVEQRNGLFKKALFYFEKSYKINPTNETKNILKTCYEVLGMEDKASSLK